MNNSLTQFDQSVALKLYLSDEPFPIDLDDAWQWLGYAQKRNCKDKLLKHFEKDLDYLCNITNKEVFNASGYVKVEHITITVDCFKSLGMMAQTEQGKVIRRYFLECEKIARNPFQCVSELNQQIQSLQEENQLLKAKTRLLESKSQPDFSKLQELTQQLAQSNPELLAKMVEKFAIACYEMGRKKNKKLPETVLLTENTIDANDLESLMPILEYIKQNNGEITTREICRKFNRKFIVDGEVRNMNSKVAYRIMEILAIAGYGEIIKTRRNSIKFEIFAKML